MSDNKDSCNKNKTDKEDVTMTTGTVVKMDNAMFNQFLDMNKEKINSIVPKNPPISKDDEWHQETFWEEDI